MLASGLVLPPLGQADKMWQVSGALRSHVISLDANYTDYDNDHTCMGQDGRELFDVCACRDKPTQAKPKNL